jgi:sRNA-binding protein
VFLTTWIDRSSDACMFSPAQLRTWTTAHLNSGEWYLDCSMTFTPLHKIDLKQSREALGVSVVDMVDLEAIEDEEAREKAVKKRAESDRKKAQKVKEAEEKAEQKEKDKQEKASEKVAEKAAEQGKGKGKKKSSEPAKTGAKVPVATSSTVDAGSKLQSVTGRGTKRDSLYEQLSQVPVVVNIEDDDISTVDEFIVNSSLAEVLSGDSGPLPPAYYDLKTFLRSVSVFSLYILIFVS